MLLLRFLFILFLLQMPNIGNATVHLPKVEQQIKIEETKKEKRKKKRKERRQRIGEILGMSLLYIIGFGSIFSIIFGIVFKIKWLWILGVSIWGAIILLLLIIFLIILLGTRPKPIYLEPIPEENEK